MLRVFRHRLWELIEQVMMRPGWNYPQWLSRYCPLIASMKDCRIALRKLQVEARLWG